MKFSKKLSLLLGASKAMKPQTNDDEVKKEDNGNPLTAPEANPTAPILLTENRPEAMTCTTNVLNPQKNDNDVLQEDNDNPTVEPENEPVQIGHTANEIQKNVPRKAPFWGKVKTNNDEEVIDKVDINGVEIKEQSPKLPVIRNNIKNDNEPKSPSLWGRIKDVENETDSQAERLLKSKNGKDIIG